MSGTVLTFTNTEQLRRPTEPLIDSAFGNPTAAGLRAHLNKGSFAQVNELLRASSDSDELAFFIQSLSEWDGRPEVIERWKMEEPDNHLAWLVSGAHAIHWAWQARGGAKADEVEQDAWQEFFRRLELAKSDFSNAAELAPEDPTPYAFMIIVCRGLNASKEATRGVFDEAINRCAGHLLAHRNLLVYLCEKWHGSHREMFEFARTSSAVAADGSLLPLLVVDAHIERWLYALAWDNDPEAERYFLRLDDVRPEVTEAYQRSLGSAAHQPGPWTRVAANSFAYALSRSNVLDDAAKALQQVENCVGDLPWGYEGDPIEIFRWYRDRVDEVRRERASGVSSESATEDNMESVEGADFDTTQRLGPLVLRCRKCSPASVWRELGGSWVAPVVLPPFAALFSTIALFAVLKALHLIGPGPQPMIVSLLSFWFVSWTAGLYLYFFNKPGAGSFDLHEHGFRYKKRRVRFADLSIIRLGRVQSGLEQVFRSLNRVAATINRQARGANLLAENSDQSSLTVEFTNGDVWSMKNVLAEYEESDLEQFITLVFSRYPELNGIRS